MLRSGLEDHRYNSQVALAKLEALCMDALKATVPISALFIPWENLEESVRILNLKDLVKFHSESSRES